MAKRQNIHTIPTVDLQGEGSFIKIKAMSVEMFDRAEQRMRDLAIAQESKDSVTIARLQRESYEDYAEVIMAWDWVDDEGKELVQPYHNPDVFAQLNIPEMVFIANQLNPFSMLEKKGATS